MNSNTLISPLASVFAKSEMHHLRDHVVEPPLFKLTDVDAEAGSTAAAGSGDDVAVVPAAKPAIEKKPLQVHWFNPAVQPDFRRPREWNSHARAANTFLSHAMEYLADSREIHPGRLMSLDTQNPDGQAILILMEAKQRIHLSLPFIERRKGSILGGWKGFERRRDRQH